MISDVYNHRFTVLEGVIDANGHANNVAYLSWMQDAALAHSDSSGGTAEAQRLGGTWVVREHTIEYLRPLFAGDAVTLETWIEDAEGVRSTRRYRLLASDSGKEVARGRTLWVFVDSTSGRPRAIPDSVINAFRPRKDQGL